MNRIKLYCLPYAGGSKYVYNDWIRIYSEAAEIIPIEYSGHGERYGEPFYRSADEAAEDIAEMIMSDKPERYALYGHSLGGTLGFLVTKKLEEDYSCKPLTLMIGGSRPPHLKYKNEKWLSLSKNEFMQRIYMMGQTDESIMKEKELYDLLYKILYADIKINEECFIPEESSKISVPILAMAGYDDERAPESDMIEWRQYTTGDFSHRSFPSNHFFSFNCDSFPDFLLDRLRMLSKVTDD